MTTIDQLIKQSLNPFDNFAAGNFWEEQEPAPTVESIHQEALTQIKSNLEQVAQDHQSRTLILYGDSGSGKTHFLGRLKQTLNTQAFFVYIEPFPQSDHIWRHILRYTVDSLVNATAGQADSQLILWLKSCLSTIREGLQGEQQSFIDRIKGILGQAKTDVRSTRQFFIDILKKTVGTTGIYNANEFFGILYDLTSPELYPLACEWLKGDDLDEENLKKLRVKHSIDNEDKARGILGNFSRISAKTQPIVLCFDQLDNIARLPDGAIDLQGLFNVNSTMYNGKWKSLLIIISIRTSTWNNNHKRVDPSDLHRVSLKVHLKRIPLGQAEAILATRLYPLHHQAIPQPVSPIYPLNQQVLVKVFPSSKASPRDVLMLGQKLFQNYKEWLVRDKQTLKPKWFDGIEQPPPLPPTANIQAECQLIWQQEYNKVQGRITKLNLLAAPELILMLQEALTALQLQGIKHKLLSGKFTSYSLSYQKTDRRERIGVVWTEDPSLQSFFNVMNACSKVVQKNFCQTLFLIRAAGIGAPKNVGCQIYKQIFTGTHHRHIKPDLSSVQCLATYHSLVNAALANELVVAGKILSLKELEDIIRESEILHKCTILQDLGVFSIQSNSRDNGSRKNEFQVAKEYLLNLVITQQFIGRKFLIQNLRTQFAQVNESEIEQMINQLCQENEIKIINPNEKLEAQLVCLLPKG